MLTLPIEGVNYYLPARGSVIVNKSPDSIKKAILQIGNKHIILVDDVEKPETEEVLLTAKINNKSVPKK
jgi:hypothetical protein